MFRRSIQIARPLTARITPRAIPRRYVTINSFPHAADPAQTKRGFKNWHLLVFISSLGVSITAYGLYRYYTSLTSYPPVIRNHLRVALRHKDLKSYQESLKAFEEAWELAKTTPFQDFPLKGKDALLKITGIAIAYAELLESQRQSLKAEEILQQAFDFMSPYLSSVTSPPKPQEIMRGIQIAIKSAQLAETTIDPQKLDLLEGQLSWSITELLRMTNAKQVYGDKVAEEPKEEQAVLASELDLPKWVTKTDLGGTMETIAGFYARQGKLEYAMPLYLQCLNLLIPPPLPGRSAKQPPVCDLCHGATIMNNLSSAISQQSTTTEKLKQATAWASKALQVATQARSQEPTSDSSLECTQVIPVALFNLAQLESLKGNNTEAIARFKEARTRAAEFGMLEGVKLASERIRELEREQ